MTDQGDQILAELRLLAREQQTAEQEERVRNRRANSGKKRLSVFRIGVIWLLCLSFAAFIWWASWAEIDTVVRGQGKVIPDSSTQVIQSLEGGILSELMVKEGERVTRGQSLARFHDRQFLAKLRENQVTRDQLRVRVVRLLAEGTGSKTLSYPPDLLGSHPELVSAEQRLFKARQSDQEAQRSVLTEKLRLSEKSYKALEQGLREGAIPLLDRFSMESEMEQLRGQIQVLDTNFRRAALELLDQERERLAALEHVITADEDRLERSIIRSPVDGVVNAIFIDTAERVVASGEAIMELVPIGDSLLVEARIRPEDIAFLRSGLKALVRFTAFDFSIYGGLDGDVETIGANTVAGPEKEEFYPIKVRTRVSTLGQDRKSGKSLELIPGMVAEVDIMVGKKTVAEYLLKPVNRAKEKALREP
jgi:adhesin transport system membrane fusion protein